MTTTKRGVQPATPTKPPTGPTPPPPPSLSDLRRAILYVGRLEESFRERFLETMAQLTETARRCAETMRTLEAEIERVRKVE